MRIVHVLNHTFDCNGNVNAAVDLACGQAALGHDVALVSGGGIYDELLAAHRVKHEIVDQTRSPVTIGRAAVRLRQLFSRLEPDIVHAHMMTGAILAKLCQPFLDYGLVTTVHNEFQKSATLMGVGDRVIAVSDAVKQSMARRGIPASRLRVVLNGTIGSPRLSLVREVSLERPAVTFVGGMHHRKGVHDLLRAFALVAKAGLPGTLHLVGEGPHKDEFRALASELGIADRCTFVGAVKDPKSYLNASDIFVLASHADPSPLVISEAREAGCAVIGTAVDGIPELLEHGKAGLLVPRSDPEALADAIGGLVADPARLAEVRAMAAYNLSRLHLGRVAQETLAVYEEAARERRRGRAKAA